MAVDVHLVSDTLFHSLSYLLFHFNKITDQDFKKKAVTYTTFIYTPPPYSNKERKKKTFLKYIP